MNGNNGFGNEFYMVLKNVHPKGGNIKKKNSKSPNSLNYLKRAL
jgi:hypothetical protein